jgi:hypothetical protein
MESLLRENTSVFAVAIGSDSAKRKYSGWLDMQAIQVEISIALPKAERWSPSIPESPKKRGEATRSHIPSGNDSASSYHKVQVKTKRKDLTAETREGYYTIGAQDSPND